MGDIKEKAEREISEQEQMMDTIYYLTDEELLDELTRFPTLNHNVWERAIEREALRRLHVKINFILENVKSQY